MIETLMPQAMAYLTDLLLKNEEVQKFPKDFLSASVRWVRSWFLEDDPVTKAIVESDKPAPVKEAVLEAKLSDLLKNPKFVQELQAQLAAYSYEKNVIKDSTLKIVGDAHIGDTQPREGGPTPTKENVIEKSQLDVGGNFRLGNG
ncbi:hypothetical protein [Spirosoma litoris]